LERAARFYKQLGDEEWKQLGQSDPFKERIANRSSDLAKSNNVKVE